MRMHYILGPDGKTAIQVDLMVWARWFGNDYNRILKRDKVSKDVRVSTVFLGLDHAFGSGPPILWETMIFGGKEDLYQDRYTSHEDAMIGHELALALAKKAS